MSDIFDYLDFTHAGRKFRANCYHDSDAGRPWENSDGHGPVRAIRSRDDKKPGERIMTSGDRHAYVWAYDVQEATKIARRDGWGLNPDELAKLAAKLGRKPTPGEIVARAVENDFEFLNGWVCDRWHYIGVSVVRIGADGKPMHDEYANACWGIESDGDYWHEVARELAQEITHEIRANAALKCKETKARNYWASRDVMTVGG
jgi:hypothetical protein